MSEKCKHPIKKLECIGVSTHAIDYRCKYCGAVWEEKRDFVAEPIYQPKD